MLSAFLGLLTFTCLFPSLFFPVAGLITTFYIPPGLPDTFAQPHQCKPNNSTSSGCSLRSAMEACTSYLVDATSLCNIILSPHDRISLDPVLGDIQLVSVSGGLEILGNGATISQMDNSFSNQERFLTLAQLSLNPLTLSISNTSFFGFSSSSGGGVFNFQNLASINLTHNSFWNNSALSGGVLYAEGCTNITISACSFEGNEAEDGGAIQFNSNNHHISIEHSRFHFNHAKGSSISNRNQGGAVYFNLLNSDVKISFCLFDTNEGINGGAVYFHTENQLIVISSCYFKNNHASFGGGVMFYNQNLYVTVKDTVLDSNTALKFYGLLMFDL